MIYQILQKKQKIEQHKPDKTRWWNVDNIEDDIGVMDNFHNNYVKLLRSQSTKKFAWIMDVCDIPRIRWWTCCLVALCPTPPEKLEHYIMERKL